VGGAVTYLQRSLVHPVLVFSYLQGVSPRRSSRFLLRDSLGVVGAGGEVEGKVGECSASELRKS
jgi:hypothetical protein